ncbi:tRNA (adenosine(37)-N6)-threonylcarbamoyltransferase complex dimerization subunit type 1 TsaB [Salinibacterium sp. G-O1]|uniref:tRNA (adenosine(37)-N6)-threonylcarbamoyltransferase complex dimerization subunit type 1 TsaB n=1 Tax=Salinibacterium sp. G-O1 TaxID=3046208 RepID=UPI0024B8C4E1|nr:tRNA (adenosine(37)-N6)-threonylcarbamoyltransferase complex dimerization subunit type 1 TsaB [Salinibacterium sp. G-O1]MDJ0334193.1 tRNA (adenosine(37)-N6)-threonylcarbamoyltransferase complex dimerization subunit type 1 TsaB [Salinibacterium sp. G-O1]
MLLAIDTSAGTSVAVVDLDGGILAELSSDDTRRHTEVIGSLIAACIADSGITVSALSGVVAGMGPGPFTGLRVGIAAARVFAVGAGTKVIPAVSHDAIAFGCTEPTLVATDARRREVYWSTYSGSDAAGLPIRTSGPNLAKVGELDTAVHGFADYRLVEAATVSAGALGMLVETMLANGRDVESSFDGHPGALYLRSPDVTMSNGPKRVTT